MEKTIEDQGTCLCGKVEIIASAVPQEFGACHCGMCRKWAAGPYFAIACGDQIQIKGEEHISVFNSSDWAERAFCNKCGTNLFYKLKDPLQYHVSASLMSRFKELRFGHQIYIDHKPTNYDFKNETPTMTEAEVLKAFAPSEK